MDDQKYMDKFTSIKQAMLLLGYKSRTSIEQKIKSGDLRFVWFAQYTSSRARMFYIKDIERVMAARHGLDLS